ncbi:MAG: DUF1559 domain-containing protein, partial [Pirellulaceae bacterium]
MVDDQPAEQEVEQDTSPDRRMGCFWRAAGLILVILIAGTIYRQFTSIPLRISEETTHITEPLTSDGKHVDYFAAIEQEAYPEGMATEKNGYRLIVEHLGMPEDCSLEDYREIRRKLGLAPSTTDNQPDMSFQEPHDFLTEYFASERFDEALVKDLLAPETPAEDALEDDSAAGAGEAGTSENGYVDEETRSGQRVAERGYDLSSDPEAAVLALADRFGAAWTLNELPMMDEWLKNNGPALDLVSRAVRQPVFRVPLAREDREDENGTLWDLLLISHVQQVRGFARGLSARAYYRIGTGQIDKAIDDIATCKRLGRHVQNGTMLVESLVGIAVEGIADSIGVGDVLKDPPTKEQLRRLLREMNDLPPRDSLQKTLRFERYVLLDVVQLLSQGKGSFDYFFDRYSPMISRCIETVGLDWNVIARRLNQHFDTLLETGRAPPRASMYRLTAISIRERSKIVADMLGNLLLPSFEAVREATRRSQCVEHMKRITLAMLIYERDHRTLPPAYSADEDGNPLHSWRVLLLPDLGKQEQELYEKIRIDEPWDSEHNRQFHEKPVQFYRCPSDSVAGPGQTSY